MKQLVFHIGHHKTGTTWLQRNYFEGTAEFNLLNSYIAPWDDELCQALISTNDSNLSKKIIDQRSKSDKVNVITAERLSGHPISGGYDMENIANCILDISADSKIIISTRSPDSFISSVYHQMIREGYRGKFNDFLYENHWKTAGPKKDYFSQKKILSKYIDLFGADNVLVLSFEEFKQNKKSYITKLNNFLEVDIRLDDSLFKELVGKMGSDKKSKAIRFLNRYRRTEYNQYPSMVLNEGLLKFLTKLLASLYSNKTLIDKDLITKYLTE